MKLTGFENIISINNFFYNLSVNEHEMCQFTVSVTDKYLDTCIAQLGNNCTIENDDFKFSGTVVEITATRTISDNILEVVIQGRTIEFDKEKKYRIFQHSQKKTSDIFKYMGMSEVKYSAKTDDIIEEIIVQSNETDWMFALRIANYLGKHIFPGESMWIGDPLDKTENIDDDIVIMKLSLRTEKSECTCRLKKKLKFGTKVNIKGKTYYVDRVNYFNEKEEYVFEYHLSEYSDERKNVLLPDFTLYAKVTDNNDPDKLGRIKVAFEEPYEDVMKDNDIWIDCDSIWASKEYGMACIPNINDTVIVHIDNNIAHIQAVKRVEPFGKRFEDCNTRYLFVDENSYMSMNGEKMLLDNSKFRCELTGEKMLLQFNEKASIEIKENEINSIADKSNLKINNNGIVLFTDKTNIELTSKTKVITDAFEIDGKKNVAIGSAKIDIKGKSGVSIN